MKPHDFGFNQVASAEWQHKADQADVLREALVGASGTQALDPYKITANVVGKKLNMLDGRSASDGRTLKLIKIPAPKSAKTGAKYRVQIQNTDQ